MLWLYKKMKEKIHSVKYNFIMNFILTASGFLFPLITSPYILRVLQVEGNGRIAFAASVTSYFSMVAALGIPTYGIRACAQVRDDKEKLARTVQEIFIINSLTAVLVCAAFLFSIWLVPRFHQEKTLFYINGVGIILNTLGVNWFFQALEQYDYITFRSLAFKVISIVLMFLLVHEQEDYLIYAGISMIAAVGSNLMNFIRMHRYITFCWDGKYELRKHMKPILILFAQNLAVSIYTNLDTVMLGFIKGDHEVGLYDVATKLKGILLSLVTSLGNVLLPRMSYYANNKMRQQFAQMMQTALNFSMMLSLPLATFFIVCSKECILLLAGSRYLDAVNAMRIITFTIIPIGITGVLGVQVLAPLEKEKYVLFSVVAGAVTDFVLNCLLIRTAGAAGAAAATVVAEIVVLVIQVIVVRRMHFIFQMRSFAKYILWVCASSIGFWVPNIIAMDNIFFRLCVMAGCFFGIYMLCCYNSKDRILQRA